MKTPSPLRHIANLLQETDFDFHFEQKQDLPPVILIDLDCENLLCEIVLTSDLEADPDSLGDDLLMVTRRPLILEASASDDFLCFCGLVSSLFGYGVLAYCERTGVLFHRYLLALPSGEADADVIARVLSQIQIVYQAAWSLLCETAAGHRSFAEAKHLLADRGFPEPPLQAFPEPSDHPPFA